MSGKVASIAVLLSLLLVPILFSNLDVTLLTAVATSTSPAVEWSQIYSGSGNDLVACVRQTSDGGYVMAGTTNAAGSDTRADFYLVKTNAQGNKEWSQKYGGTGYENAYSVQQTNDGGYIIAGDTAPLGEEHTDMFLVKTDSNGTLTWSKKYGESDWEHMYSVQQTRDGGYIVAGVIYIVGEDGMDRSAFWLVKTSSTGSMEWSQKYGGMGAEWAYSVQQTRDGGYIVAGYAFNGDQCDFWLVKTDSSGTMQWDKKYGGADYEYAYSVQQTSDDGYIIAGWKGTWSPYEFDFWLVKTDSSGTMQWNRAYGSTNNDLAYWVQQTTDGGYIVAGQKGQTINAASWLVKTSGNGTMEWSQTVGGSGAKCVQETEDGGYIVVGDNSGGIEGSAIFLVKLEGSKDTDGDGLLDTWEQNGIDYNKDGIIELDLPALGADWQHKDLFVEVDYMQGHYPNPDAMTAVKAAFTNAPVTNPDGMSGINLHIEVDEPIPHQDLIKEDFTLDFDNLKSLYFGTATQRGDSNSQDILDAKKLAYRYCIFVNKISSLNGTQWVEANYAGMGEFPGNDFIVAMGGFPGGTGTSDDQAGAFMHELGHNLGLHHGGGDAINFKPNYLSVMNYAFAFSALIPWRPLDYSRKELPILYEGGLDEPSGIQSSGFWQYTVWNNSRKEYAFGLVSEPLDWNGNGNKTERLVRVNINNFTAWGYSSEPDEALEGYDDWANLKLAFGDTEEFLDGVHLHMSGEEITSDIVEAMREAALSMGVEPTSPAPTADVSPQSSPGDRSAGLLANTNYLVIGGAVVAVAVVTAIFMVFRKRKRHLT